MDFVSVIVAGCAGFAFGAVWYGFFSKAWVTASGVPVGKDGAPANRADPVPYVTSLIGCILVAGMMRHVFELAQVDSFGKTALSGFGIGLFMVSPWVATFYSFAAKPRRLILIDGGYATFGCTVIGAVLSLF